MIGVINILKPAGMSSNNVVVDVRKILNVKKVGHMGTLDPGANGVLPIGVGKATRLFPYLVEKDKEYICELQFGQSTDTLDAYGTKTAESECAISYHDMETVLPKFLGEQWQTPPLYSALKVDGHKMYELARDEKKMLNIDVEKKRQEKRRKITISDIELLHQTAENQFLFRVVCSRGTYIRALCEDIAQELNCCGYMSFLLRSRVGIFDVERSVTLDELRIAVEQNRTDFWANMDDVLYAYPRYDVPSKDFQKLRNGVPLHLPKPILESEYHSIYCHDELFGIGSWEHAHLKLNCFLWDGVD